ncbi:hypothetical protein MTR67_005008 [Solanum verrucosum]|uniref:Uncharacterized protein n=1 Tax=Solanum verrucosum TaxID=315347 RepID=A0AAF0PV57_SOLVR|nr:hypothetical protein MTR67_005008 [Solanum verrucosum]
MTPPSPHKRFLLL